MSSENAKEKKVQAALRQETTPAPNPELARIFQQHHNRVIQAAYRVTGSLSDAEDVLQTVFLRLLRRHDLPNRSEKLGSYLHRAAINAGIDLIRSRKQGKKVALEDAGPLPETRNISPDDRQASLELEDWLRSTLSGLSPQSAEVFALRYLEGYGNQEIAELIGTSPGVVAVVLHRTRTRLRTELSKFLGGTFNES